MNNKTFLIHSLMFVILICMAFVAIANYNNTPSYSKNQILSELIGHKILCSGVAWTINQEDDNKIISYYVCIYEKKPKGEQYIDNR